MRFDRVELTQIERHVKLTIPFGEQNDKSEVIRPPVGFRGIAIAYSGTWTAADIAFYGSPHEGLIVPLRDNNGVLVVCTGILTAGSGLYVPGAESWALGACRFLQLASVAVGAETPVAQAAARELTLVFMT